MRIDWVQFGDHGERYRVGPSQNIRLIERYEVTGEGAMVGRYRVRFYDGAHVTGPESMAVVRESHDEA